MYLHVHFVPTHTHIHTFQYTLEPYYYDLPSLNRLLSIISLFMWYMYNYYLSWICCTIVWTGWSCFWDGMHIMHVKTYMCKMHLTALYRKVSLCCRVFPTSKHACSVGCHGCAHVHRVNMACVQCPWIDTSHSSTPWSMDATRLKQWFCSK